VPTQYQGAIRSQWVQLRTDGTFTATLTLKDAATPPAGGTYGVYTYGAGGVSNSAQEKSVPLSYSPAPKVVPSVSAASEASGLTVNVAGTQFGTRTGEYVALIEKGTEASVTAGSGFAAMQYVRGISGGAFSVDLVAPAAKLERGAQYEVIAWQQHTLPDSTTIHARADVSVSPAQWDAVFPPASVAASVTSATADAGATVHVTADGLGDITGAYVAVIEKGSDSGVTAGGGFTAMQYVRGIADGAFELDLVAPTANLDRSKQYEVIVWQQHTLPGIATVYARSAVPFTDAHWNALFPGTTPTPKPPVTPTKPATPALQGAGSLRWAVSSSFSSYVTGDIAHGSITVSGGATRAGGVFQFGQATGSTYSTGSRTGSVPYAGSVRFAGHGGALDVTIANPQVRITSPSSATLYVTSGGSQVAFASLNLSAGRISTTSGAVTYSAVPATLTAAGRSQVFQGFTTTLDPVTFTVGVAAAAPAGSTGTVATASTSASQDRELPATPPASTGIQLDTATLDALSTGARATVSTSGFQPNESGIAVVVYSTPTLLGEVTADASGTATWTGTLPASLADGEHTLTFQGSVDRGIRFTLARATTAVDGCAVTGATLEWGFKESFRTYIEGIAAGGWDLTDVVYEYPAFVWAPGEGAVDASARTGLVTYGGAIRFTGHDGALDTTIANARVELAGDVGYLVFDVTGTTQDGAAVEQSGVRLAEFALPDLELTADGLVLDALPTTLTAAGAAAFGTYAAGESLDPVTAVLPVPADCGQPAPTEPEAAPAAVVAPDDAAATTTAAPAWPWAIGGLAIVAAIGGAAWILASRRRATAGDREGPDAG
jgi:hypothetical protein